MLPSLSRLVLHTEANKKRKFDDKNAAEDARVLNALAYRGQTVSLKSCLDGGHFSFDEDTAYDYATSAGDTADGYLIEVNPLGMYLSGATFGRGSNWDTKLRGHGEPYEGILAWKEAVRNGRVSNAAPTGPRTEQTFLLSTYWMQPTDYMRGLLDTVGSSDPPPYDELSAKPETELVQVWEQMALAAGSAAPWNFTMFSNVDEFTAKGFDVVRGAVTRVWEIHNFEKNRVFKRNPGSALGSAEALQQFRDWEYTRK